MKKTLFAALLLTAFGGIVHAQSVTAYGLVDLGMARVDLGSARGAYLVTNNVTSRLGFRGTEDLGGGLKAQFQLEAELAADTGAADSSAFWGRQAWVGLSDSWGSLRLGRTKNITDALGDDIDPFQTNGVVGDRYNKVVWRAGVLGSRVSNAMVYATPRMGGFRVQAEYVFDELATGGKQGWAVAGTYEAKSFGVLAAYEKPAVTTAGQAQDKHWLAGAWVKLADFRLSAGLTKGERPRNAREEKGLLLGLQYDLTKEGRINLSYGKLERKTFAGVKSDRVDAWGIGYEHNLSKRTGLYAMVVREDVEDAKGFQVGLTHRF